MSPEFLTLDDVLDIHGVQLARYGGSTGIRDQALLVSALSQPPATFDGEFLHANLFSMAAAYLFHIVKNHAFIDGNKRTGLLAALVFLDINGVSIGQGSEKLFELTMAVAEGRMDKDEVAESLKQIAEID